MEMQIRAPGAPACLVPGEPECSARHVEDEHLKIGLGVPIEVVRECREHVGRYGHGSTAGVGLRGFHDLLTRHARASGSGDGEGPTQQVDVPAVKSEDLTTAKLAPGGQEDAHTQVVGHRVRQRLYFGDGGDRPFRCVLTPGTLHPAWVPTDAV